jgi:rod shape determining protein RodA
MASGIMPVTGIPLPFITSGGSSMLANMMAVGLVINVGLKGERPMF